MKRRDFLKVLGQGTAMLALPACAAELSGKKPNKVRPNILFCISDDQSWLHAGAYGDKVVKTPNFDRIAREGVLFTHAFSAATSCTASRSAILTGQQIWRLEEGGLLMGALPRKFPVYTDLLEAAGYHVGYVHKGWSPGNYEVSGWDHNPAGAYKYSERRIDPPASGIGKTDYAGCFEDFLKDRQQGQPFCFWYGCKEPHRTYEKGSGLRSGKKLEDVVVPKSLPDVPEIRSDMLDYYLEIEWFDEHLGRMIKLLEDVGELDNTLVVVTSDNGMPFPRAKANLYDLGVRMPLAVRWARRAAGGRVVDDFVSLTDLAPTFLEAAGLAVPPQMTGRSLIDILSSDKSGRVDPRRDRVFTANERTTWCRPNGAGYPGRAIRTHRWLYIRNYEPDRWPAGDPDIDAEPEGVYGDINAGPAKTYMIEHKDDPKVAPLFELGFGKRPAEELYDVAKDQWQIHSLADDAAYSKVKTELRSQLEQYQRDTKDPRIEGKSPWDYYPYYYGGSVKQAARPGP
ncbi:MAG TPA: sulfatase-like hydrolase/transferase [Sedimentisphaerales bacterium]|nr:sulfatase-like hydrolase/transferase [Sedimentisphaerales bacterium]